MTDLTTQRNIDMGNRIRVLRNAAHMTQEVFAEKVGISVQYVSDLERGVVGPSIRTLIRITEELHTSCDYLLFGHPESSHLQTYIERLMRLPEYEQQIIEQQLTILEEALRYRREYDVSETK